MGQIVTPCVLELACVTMTFYRALTKQLVTTQAQSRIAAVPWYQQDQKAQLSLFEKWVEDKVYPHYFRWVKGPYERYHYNRTVADLRAYGLMFDDKYHTHHPLIERVIEILPQDLAVGRYRRLMRASEMSLKKTHLPLSEQNYDPMVPYMAPFIEEAKFQMQEEQELLRYHPWDRRLYSAGLTGFGETSQASAFSTW